MHPKNSYVSVTMLLHRFYYFPLSVSPFRHSKERKVYENSEIVCRRTTRTLYCTPDHFGTSHSGSFPPEAWRGPIL